MSPGRDAIIDYRNGAARLCSFAELDEKSAKIAALFWSKGLRAGDTVLMFQPMSIELYQLIAAIFRSGLVAIFIDPGLDRQAIRRFCEQQEPKAIVFSPAAQLFRFLLPSLRHVPVKIGIGMRLPGDTSWTDYRRLIPRSEVMDVPSESPALISLTSGSTGTPKGIARSHGFLLRQHRILQRTLSHQPGEISLVTLPMFVLSNLASGVSSILPRDRGREGKQSDMQGLVELVRRHEPTNAIGGPAFFQRMAGYCRKNGVILPCLSKVFVGGAPVLPKLFDDLKAVSQEAVITAVYGATEAEPIATLSFTDSTKNDFDQTEHGRGLLVGRSVDGIEVKVLADQWGKPISPISREAFEAQLMPHGQIGEIVVSGAHVLNSYLEGPYNLLTKIDVEETKWHRTGDAGYFDGIGRLWLVGRCVARIANSTKCIYPLMIECAARSMRGVCQAALTTHKGCLLLLLEADSRGAIDIAKVRAELSWAGIGEYRIVKRIPVDRRHHSKIDLVALNRLVKRIAILDTLSLRTVRGLGPFARG